MEDLDALLQDLEINYPSSYSKKMEKNGKKEITQLEKKLNGSELPLDLSDILTLDIKEEAEKTKETITLDKIKCYPVFLAGTKFSNGCSNFSTPSWYSLNYCRRCSSLHCRNCDFKISQFENFEWVENTDYLFLRTNMPKLEKIFKNLKKKNGSVAYACHCVSYSTEELYPISMAHSLPWFCRGHFEPK